MTDAATARRMWTLRAGARDQLLRAPAKSAFERGLRGFWRGYFAGRAAPIGPVGAAPVVAAFFSFAPGMVERALPAVWELIAPADALTVRQAGAVAALRELLGLRDGDPVPAPVAAAADRLAAWPSALTSPGARSARRTRRCLCPSSRSPGCGTPPRCCASTAATATSPRSSRRTSTRLKRSSCGLAPTSLPRAERQCPESASAGGAERALMQPARGWTDDEWDAAAARLVGRGLLQPDGAATEGGAQLHRSIEAATDQAAARPWAGLQASEVDELADLLLPIARACAVVLPFPNPVGVPAPVPPAEPSSNPSRHRSGDNEHDRAAGPG